MKKIKILIFLFTVLAVSNIYPEDPVYSLRIDENKLVYLDQPIEELVALLGPPERTKLNIINDKTTSLFYFYDNLKIVFFHESILYIKSYSKDYTLYNGFSVGDNITEVLKYFRKIEDIRLMHYQTEKWIAVVFYNIEIKNTSANPILYFYYDDDGIVTAVAMGDSV